VYIEPPQFSGSMEQRVFKPGLRRRWRSFTRNIPLPDCLEDNRIAIAIRPDLPDQFFGHLHNVGDEKDLAGNRLRPS
jgi:hypothetical protein